jgi:hypothetical protein
MTLDVEESESRTCTPPAAAKPFAPALDLARALEAALAEYAETGGESLGFRVRLARAQALGLVDLIEELALGSPTSRPLATIRSGIFPVASAHDDSLETSDGATAIATLKTCA